MAHLVYLVRHGQSEWNLLRLTQGQTPHPRLTALGRRQAVAAARLVAADLDRSGMEVGRVVTSDLARAVETATVIGDRLGVVPERDARLREQHLGRLQGASYEETRAAEAVHAWNPDTPVAGGESRRAVAQRMVAVVEGLAAGCGNVVVSHGDSIRAAIAHLSGLASGGAWWREIPNGAVVRFDGRVTCLSSRPPSGP